MTENVDDILHFWFGDEGIDSPADSDFQRWYMHGQRLDATVTERFGALLEAARSPEVLAWRESARGALAHVLLTDQFPLHIYRRQAQAFHWERDAVDTTLAGIEQGFDRELGLGGALFFYLPLMHAEDLALQRRSIDCLVALRDRVPAAQRQRVEQSIDFGQGHADIIERFGRFPHRNEALGRPSTAEEVAYLAEGGARFGQ